MKRRPERLRRSMREALQAASVATWTGPRPLGTGAGALVFAAAPGQLPAGHRVYGIGDVHGELAALRTLHRAVAEDLAARPTESAILIHLGDLIDHGPDSAGVVAWLAGGMSGYGLRSMTLRGDHEQMLLDALDGDRAAATDWLHAGGAASLRSWGIAEAQRQDWPALLPPAHVAFLRALPLSWQVGSYLFVHAGIRPRVPLTQQSAADLLTIRQPFLAAGQLPAVVVHGHTVVPAPEVTASRIAIDTGAGFGGRLTCAVLEADSVAFLSPAIDGSRC